MGAEVDKAKKQDMLGIFREGKEDNVAGAMGTEREEMRLESHGDGLGMPLWLRSPPTSSSGSAYGGAVPFWGGLDIPRSQLQSHPFPSPFTQAPSTLTPALPVLESRIKKISKKADLFGKEFGVRKISLDSRPGLTT